MGRLDERRDESMTLTPEQTGALQSVSDEIRECARRVIERLNDIGQLVEDGFIDRRVFFGKYHVMVIQSCHLVEAIRREEEAQRGGNYGQRLLRMRHRAIMYNDIWPKHRAVPIRITREQSTRLFLGDEAPVHPVRLLPEQRVIYQSPTPTIVQRMIWALRRWLSWY
jgi:hypothetical protein